MGKTFKYLFITIIVGASLFISKPAYSFMGYWYDYNTGWIEQDIMRRTFENHNRVFNNSSSNDDYMKPMQNQLKTVLQDVDDFDKMSNSDKKYIYDQLVIIGMTLTINQYQNQQNPNAKVTAQLRNAGKQVLEGLLGVSASKVKITSSGLSF